LNYLQLTKHALTPVLDSIQIKTKSDMRIFFANKTQPFYTSIYISNLQK